MRRPVICICENKGADQLHGNRAADQGLCLPTLIVQSFYFLYPKYKASNHLLWLYSSLCVGLWSETLKTGFLAPGSFKFIT